MCEQILISWLNLIVLTATLLFIARYTYITNKLYQSSQKQLSEITNQRRLSIIPTLYPELIQHGVNSALHLTNIGNGVAVNIHFDKVNYASPELVDTYYEFENVPMLRPNDPIMLKYKSYVLGKMETESNSLPPLGPFANTDVQLRMTFQNLNGENYIEAFQMGKNGLKFISLNMV